jgi:hypothetical protein
MKVPEANQAPQTFAQVFAEPGQLCHDERSPRKFSAIQQPVKLLHNIAGALLLHYEMRNKIHR